MNLAIRLALFFPCVLVMVPEPVFAQALKIAPPPAVEKIDTETLQSAVKAALGCGVDYLIHEEETNKCGFLYSPMFRSNIVSYNGFKEVEYRYKAVVVERPVYQPILEPYETFEVGGGASGADARNLRKVTRMRVVGQKKTGTTIVTQTVYDAKGPIVVKQKVPIDPVWERKTYWTDGLPGLNGMGMHVLLKCGMYERTNIIQTVARNFENYIEYHGIPDMTWDVAWLAAAFINLPDQKYHTTRDKLLNKLLDGQIVEGPARGMWGPICIRGETLATMLAYEQTLGRSVNKSKEMARKKAGIKLREEMAAEAENVLKDFQVTYKLYTQHGTRFDDVTSQFVVGNVEDSITMMGLPYFFYNQAVADMESTALALFVLREAAEKKCLPAKTIKPVGARKKMLMPGEDSSAILARAAAAITGMQKQDGAWDECNIHEAISAFIPFEMPPLQADMTRQLPSPSTQLATIQGLAALIDVGYAVGFDKLMGKYRKQVEAGYGNAIGKINVFLDNPARKDDVGRLIPPYDMAVKSGVLLRGGSAFADNRRDLWMRLAFLLVNQQSDTGAWNSPNGVMLSSGLLALYDENGRVAHEARMANVPEEKRTKYNRDQGRAHLQIEMRHLRGNYLATCYAMLALLDGVREPVAGFYSEKPGDPMPVVLPVALNILERDVGLDLVPLRATLATPAGIIRRLPVLVFDGKRLPESDASKAMVEGYALGTGFLVIERPVDAGETFEGAWAAIVKGSAGNVPDDANFMKDIKFKVQLRGLFGADGQLTGVFLPQMKNPQGQPIADPRAVAILGAIIRGYADPAYFDKDYPIKIRGFSGEPFVARIAMLDQMNIEARGVSQQLPDRAATPAPAAAPARVVPVALPPEENVELTESGVPIPKTKAAAPAKADEVW